MCGSLFLNGGFVMIFLILKLYQIFFLMWYVEIVLVSIWTICNKCSCQFSNLKCFSSDFFFSWVKLSLVLKLCQNDWNYWKKCQKLTHQIRQWMPKICVRYAQDMPGICLRYAQDMPEICPRYAKDISNICQRYVRYMPKICPRYAQDMAKICKISKTLLSEWVSNMDTRDACASKNSDLTLEAKKGGLFAAQAMQCQRNCVAL